MDSFFPFLEEVGKEVVEVEDFVFSDDFVTKSHAQVPTSPVSPQVEISANTEKHEPMGNLSTLVEEKLQSSIERTNVVKTRFSLPRPTLPLFIRRLKRAVLSLSIPVLLNTDIHRTAGDSTSVTLRRMARTRRLVTSLARLLATKSEVVAQIQKRLLTSGQSGLGNGAGKDDDIEVAIYMGDVQGKRVSVPFRYVHDVESSMPFRSYPDLTAFPRPL